jgi:hypothetical protein
MGFGLIKEQARLPTSLTSPHVLGGITINMKYKVTIDIDEADTSIRDWADNNTDTYRDGIWGVDKVGVYHMYYKSRSNIIEFKDPEELK